MIKELLRKMVTNWPKHLNSKIAIYSHWEVKLAAPPSLKIKRELNFFDWKIDPNCMIKKIVTKDSNYMTKVS